MRPTLSLPVLAVLLLSALFAGCSERAARITGNERLLRGSGGLGTTSRGDTLVDRDTYIPPASTALRGATLLVGRRDAFEARSLFRVATWNLPSATDTSVHVVSVTFNLEFDGDVDEDLPVGVALSLHQAGAPWDTTNVAWPGPPLGTQLVSAVDDIAPLDLDMGISAIDSLQSWSQNADTTGFVLVAEAGQGVRGFKAGTGFFRVIFYRFAGTGVDTDTLDTRIPTDLTIHTPIAPATGSETVLPLGGFYRSEVLLRAPVAPPPQGFSINGASFVVYTQNTGAFPTDETVEIRAFRIRNAWTEGGVVADTSLGLDATALSVLPAYRVRTGSDSLVIPIPPAVAREWSQNLSANEGVLVRVTDSFTAPTIQLYSRESARPPVFRVSTTTPPPGRF